MLAGQPYVSAAAPTTAIMKQGMCHCNWIGSILLPIYAVEIIRGCLHGMYVSASAASNSFSLALALLVEEVVWSWPLRGASVMILRVPSAVAMAGMLSVSVARGNNDELHVPARGAKVWFPYA